MESVITSNVPKVSVIMPSYNTAELIAASLDSVLTQSFQDFEIIVVNDGSPDTSALERVLAPYMDKIVYMRQPNKRAAGARNTAIRRARGELLAFLDSDDCWLPGHLAAQVQLLDEDPDLDFVYSDAYAFSDPRLQDTFMHHCPSDGPATFLTLVQEKCQVPVSTVVVRKSILERAGLFDEKLPRCDDYDMWLRSAFYGARIGYRRTVQARLNGGRPGALGASSAKMLEACTNILDKMNRELPLSMSERSCVESRISEIRARYLFEEGKVQLSDGDYEKAKELFAEANRSLRRWLVRGVQLGLNVAPRTTRTLVSIARSVRRQFKSGSRKIKGSITRKAPSTL
jgi:glycosyltransferase involved in cell wall biosynthesis